MFKLNKIAPSIAKPQDVQKPTKLEIPKVGGCRPMALLAWVAVDDVEDVVVELVVVDILVVAVGLEVPVRVTPDGSGRPS